VAAVEKLAQDQSIPIVHFEKGQRKETVAEPYFAQAARSGRDQVALIGIAQERANVFRPPNKSRQGKRAKGSPPAATAPL
jgi:UDP-N-acetylglucosamine 2-epimerase